MVDSTVRFFFAGIAEKQEAIAVGGNLASGLVSSEATVVALVDVVCSCGHC